VEASLVLDSPMKDPYEVFRDSIAKDGPDWSILDKLDNEERSLLSVRLRRSHDYYDLLAIGYLKLLECKGHLDSCLQSGDRMTRLAASRALVDIGFPDESMPILMAEITGGDHSRAWDRIKAIELLIDVSHPLATAALKTAITDPEYLVRYNAATVLVHNLGRSMDSGVIAKQLAEYNFKNLRDFANGLF